MRISDWVSDVCSSDLCPLMPGAVSWPGSRRNPGPDAVPGLPGRRRGIIPAILPVELQMTSFNPLDLLISPAYAQAGQAPQGGGLSFLIMPIVLIAVTYFLMIRPQMKRAKEHRAMLEKLGNGDEVITNGGMAGVVREIGDSFITIEIADNVRVRVQKAAIGNVLPKGTLKSA